VKHAGLVPFSTVDFPGRLAAVVFSAGCPLRCRYCHNAHLRRAPPASLDWDATVGWLRRRIGLLDAVVFSGGEPTIQSDFPAALAQVRDLGFASGLHSAGVVPERLRRILPLLDWIGLDIKAPFDRYGATTGVAGSGDRARRALDLVLASGIAHEIRTTVHPDLLTGEDLLAMSEVLGAHGVQRWVLQEFRREGCTDTALVARVVPVRLDTLLPALRALVPDVTIRRAN